MAITVKQKIRLGTLFLFSLLLLSGGVSIYHLVRMQNDSKEILKDNYESLSYSHGMMEVLDSAPVISGKSAAVFDSLLKLQDDNITEPGESDITSSIRQHFNM